VRLRQVLMRLLGRSRVLLKRGRRHLPRARSKWRHPRVKLLRIRVELVKVGLLIGSSRGRWRTHVNVWLLVRLAIPKVIVTRWQGHVSCIVPCCCVHVHCRLVTTVKTPFGELK